MASTKDEQIVGELFASSQPESPYSVALSYVENHLVALSEEQAAGLTLLRLMGKQYEPLIDAVLSFRSLTGDVEPILRAIEAIAMYSKFQGFSGSLVRERRV